MKVINHELGRVVLLIPWEDLRPIGGIHFPSAMEMIKARYAFASSPSMGSSIEQFQHDGMKFQTGKLVIGGNQTNISELAFYSDGIVINGYSTEESEAFLNDLLEWGKQSFGIRVSGSKERRMYVSQVIVEFDNDINPLMDGLEELTKRLSLALKKLYGITQPMEWAGMSFNYDRTAVPTMVFPAGFIVERRVSHPFESNRYYSESALSTSAHIELLQLIEKLAHPQ